MARIASLASCAGVNDWAAFLGRQVSSASEPSGVKKYCGSASTSDWRAVGFTPAESVTTHGLRYLAGSRTVAAADEATDGKNAIRSRSAAVSSRPAARFSSATAPLPKRD